MHADREAVNTSERKQQRKILALLISQKVLHLGIKYHLLQGTLKST